MRSRAIPLRRGAVAALIAIGLVLEHGGGGDGGGVRSTDEIVDREEARIADLYRIDDRVLGAALTGIGAVIVPVVVVVGVLIGLTVIAGAVAVIVGKVLAAGRRSLGKGAVVSPRDLDVGVVC